MSQRQVCNLDNNRRKVVSSYLGHILQKELSFLEGEKMKINYENTLIILYSLWQTNSEKSPNTVTQMLKHDFNSMKSPTTEKCSYVDITINKGKFLK